MGIKTLIHFKRISMASFCNTRKGDKSSWLLFMAKRSDMGQLRVIQIIGMVGDLGGIMADLDQLKKKNTIVVCLKVLING